MFLPPHRWLEKVGSIAGSMKGLEFSEWWGWVGGERQKQKETGIDRGDRARGTQRHVETQKET